MLDRHAARVDGQPRQQIGDRQRLVDFEGFSVERDKHDIGCVERDARGFGCANGSAYCANLRQVKVSSELVPVDRPVLLDRFHHSRARTRALFDLVHDSAYYERPIALRNPIVFYEGHLPAFAVNTLIKKGLGRPGIDERLETIFARGIDPDTEAAAVARGNPAWPSRAVVREYARAADALIADAIRHADLERDDHPLLQDAQALWTILEHEDMHQETLAYMWHQLPYAVKRKPEHYVTAPPRLAPHRAGVAAPALRARAPGSGIRRPSRFPAATSRWGHATALPGTTSGRRIRSTSTRSTSTRTT